MKENRERRREYLNKWQEENRDKTRAYNKKYKEKQKMIVFNHYSGDDIGCACCGENDIRFLTIDHVNNNGAEQRRTTHTSGGHMYYNWIIKNDFPDGYQVLCYNCNMAKGIYGVCPHNL